ncbi:MAG: ATP-binding cassette domain-containing protein [Myxococcota bacterium]|nr:ATP-binding cassette domain-containing protein [Myxococcota bacterium]
MISINHLTRRYGPLTAVDDLSIEIGRGEIVGLLGHNGAGKTTVMKILTGFLEASAGSVSVAGVDVSTDRAGVQRQIGYLPENAPLYPEMLVQEYLAMIAGLRAVPDGSVDGAVVKAALAVGVEEHLARPIGELSKGYRQRVGIAQAILHEPDVLVLDEPTNGLDPVQIQSIRALIRELSQNTTIILSTHILQEIEAVCDRVLIMIEGCLVADEPLADLVASDVVRVSLDASATDVEARLSQLPGVRTVTPRGADPRDRSFAVWGVACEAGSAPVSGIIDVARTAGWEIGAVAPESRTLESVFEELQSRRADELLAHAAAPSSGGTA